MPLVEQINYHINIYEMTPKVWFSRGLFAGEKRRWLGFEGRVKGSHRRAD